MRLLHDRLNPIQKDSSEEARKEGPPDFGEMFCAELRDVAEHAAEDRQGLTLRFGRDLQDVSESAASDQQRLSDRFGKDILNAAARAEDRHRLARRFREDLRLVTERAAEDRQRLAHRFANDLRRVTKRTAEDSRRMSDRLIGKALDRSVGTSWIRRTITVEVWVAVGTGISLLAIGALLRPVLDRMVQILFGG